MLQQLRQQGVAPTAITSTKSTIKMNANELRAMLLIANKLGWNGKPACEVIQKINRMVLNQQALEADCVGDYDDFEDTLLSISLWDIDKIISTQYVSDYQDLVMWNAVCFAESIHVAWEDFTSRLDWESARPYLMAEQYEAEDSFAQFASEYNDADWHDHYNYGVYMGWY
jgi:hypothetical protein